LDLGIKFGIIGKSGSWFSYNDIQLGQGRDRALEFLKENPKILSEIEQKIMEEVKKGVSYGTEER
jgi:recombination protein RecA